MVRLAAQLDRIDYVQDRYARTSDWKEVIELADALYKYMGRPSTQVKLRKANQPRRSSAEVQGRSQGVGSL